MTTYHWLALFVAVNILDAVLTLYAMRPRCKRSQPIDARSHAGDAARCGAVGRQGRVHHCGGRDAGRRGAVASAAHRRVCRHLRLECRADCEAAQGLKNGHRRVDHRVSVGA
jgi:hypothetical protein